MRLSVSSTPSNTPSNTPSVTPSSSSCPLSCYNIGDGFNDAVLKILIESDDKIMAVGEFGSYSGSLANKIIRLNGNLTIDTTFNSGLGLTTGTAYDIAKQTDGKYIVCGDALQFYDSNPINGIVRVNSDGSYDSSFSTLVFNLGTVRLNTCDIDTSGKIYTGGVMNLYDGNPQNGIIRLNSDGSQDLSFAIGTGFNPSIIQKIIAQSDGKVLVGGQFTQYSGVSANRIIRLNNDGSIDNTFNYGTGFNANVLTMIQQSDGKYMVGGTFTQYSGQSAGRIIRLNSDGSVDNTFSAIPGFTGQQVTDISIQTSGKYLVGGSFLSYSGQLVKSFCRLNIDGSLDNTFNAGFDTFSASGIGSLSNGDIIVSSNNPITYDGEGPYNYIIRLDVDGISEMCVTGATPTPTSTSVTPTPTPTNTETPTNTPTNTETPTNTPTNTSTPTPTPTSGTIEYDVYTADEYSCPGCTVLSSGVLVAFPQGQSVTIGRWYPDAANTSHSYLITGVSTGAGYILTNIYGSFTSCGGACGI